MWVLIHFLCSGGVALSRALLAACFPAFPSSAPLLFTSLALVVVILVVSKMNSELGSVSLPSLLRKIGSPRRGEAGPEVLRMYRLALGSVDAVTQGWETSDFKWRSAQNLPTRFKMDPVWCYLS